VSSIDSAPPPDSAWPEFVEHAADRVEGGDELGGHLAIGLDVLGQLAEDALAALHAPQDGRQLLGDPRDVVHQVLARGAQTVDVGDRRGADRAPLRDLGKLRRARGDLDVLVAQQAEGADAGHRVLADARGEALLDADADLDLVLAHVLREVDGGDRADPDAVELHVAPLLQSGDGVEADEVLVLGREQVAPLADGEDRRHAESERDQQQQTDPTGGGGIG
jgi:hypothetical protein